jgi:hypothetical protein
LQISNRSMVFMKHCHDRNNLVADLFRGALGELQQLTDPTTV